MMSVLGRLHDAFLHDEDLDDDLDAILSDGPAGLSRRPRRPGLWERLRSSNRQRADSDPALGRRIEHLRRTLDQLVNIAGHRDSTPELDEATSRAWDLGGQMPVGDFTGNQAYLRRMALAALELLDLLSNDETDALPTFGEPMRTDESRA